jgi:hypothetical protein
MAFFRLIAAGILVGGMAFQVQATMLLAGPGTGTIALNNPVINGTGPYTATVDGTLSIDKDTKGYVGTNAKVNRNFTDYIGAVSLPKGDPTVGGAAVPVKYTFTLPAKGTYKGNAELKFLDAGGLQQIAQSAITITIN